DILRIKPFRVIFNPGTENPAAYGPLRSAGIEPLEACTLVMLSTGQF
ncbi:MAG: CoA-binding protein, partial [Nitrospiraceae bacterium]|nr:CoA-binding protein [Nitrospiraceae bacterium]